MTTILPLPEVPISRVGLFDTADAVTTVQFASFVEISVPGPGNSEIATFCTISWSLMTRGGHSFGSYSLRLNVILYGSRAGVRGKEEFGCSITRPPPSSTNRLYCSA